MFNIEFWVRLSSMIALSSSLVCSSGVWTDAVLVSLLDLFQTGYMVTGCPRGVSYADCGGA